MAYSTDLTPAQAVLVKSMVGGDIPRLRKYDFIDVLNAIAYVIKTGCPWQMLPEGFPHWKMPYHHFRSWSDRGWFSRMLECLTAGKRGAMGVDPSVACAVVDSQSVRSALPQSQKGVDGHKRIKGIKRHVAVDEYGYPLAAHVTTANVHNSKAALPLVASLLSCNGGMSVIKADKGYQGAFQLTLAEACGIEFCFVKSNFGISDFVPMEGRWVVERTFSWMENYRRLNRNYEKHLHVAAHVFMAACMLFMLRYFR